MRTKLILLGMLVLSLCQVGSGQTLDHPRLLVTQDEVDSLWTRVNQSGSAADTLFWVKLLDHCDSSLAYPPDESYYQYRQISKLAFAALLLRESSDTTDLARAEEYTDSALSYCQTYVLPDTTTHHFARDHRINALAITYDYLYDDPDFTDSLKTVFEESLIVNMDKAWHHIINPRWYHNNNHTASQCAALLFGAIALDGDENADYPDSQAQADIDLVKAWMFTNSDSHIRRMYGQDGSCVEGLHYGFVNLMHTLPCLQTLTARESTDWFQQDYIRDRLSIVPRWMAYETLPFPDTHTSSTDTKLRPIMNILNDTWNYGGNSVWGEFGNDGYDPGDNVIRMLTLSALYDEDQDLGVWVFHQAKSSIGSMFKVTGEVCSSDEVTVEDFIMAMLYYDHTPTPDPATVLPLCQYFRDRGLVYWRTGWEHNDIQFAFECAPALNYSLNPPDSLFSVKHDQSDKNNFTLYAYGERFAIDYGWASDNDTTGNYTSWNNYITINGDLNGDGEGIFEAYLTNGRIAEHVTADFTNYVHGDAEDAFDKLWWQDEYGNPEPYDDPEHPIFSPDKWYLNPVNKADRYVQFIRSGSDVPPYFVIADDIAKDGSPHDYTWYMHSQYNNAFSSTDSTVRIVGANDGNVLKVFFASPETIQAEYSDVVVLYKGDKSEWHPQMENTSIKIKKIRVQPTSQKVNPYFHAILFPYYAGSVDSAHLASIPVTGGSLGTLTWNSPGSQDDYTDYSIFTHGDSISGDTVSTDAALSLVRKNTTQDQITRFIMSEGSELTFQETLLVDLYGITGTVVNSGVEVDMYGEDIVDFKVYAPEVQTVELNDAPVSFYQSGNYITGVPDHITENTTWEMGSTVIVMKDLIVDPGVTLTIEPGTTIKFAQNKKLQINGVLQAEGSTLIYFTALDTTKQWSGILFADSSDDALCIMKNCFIEYAASGIACNSASPDTIDNIFMRHCDYGIKCTDNSSPRISTATMWDGTVPIGIYCGSNSDPTIDSVWLDGYYALGSKGIQIVNSDPVIQGGSICNFERGIDICGGNPDIRGVELKYNTECGIACNIEGGCDPCSAYIAHNDIFFNQTGIKSVDASPTVYRNRIMDSDSVGVWCSGTDTPNLGVDATADSGYNEICNDLWNVYSECSGTTKAERNWWGDVPPDSTKFYGLIDYLPYLLQSPDSTMPECVTDLTAILSKNSIVLQWSAVTTDIDGRSEAIKCYVVYRNTEPGFFPEPLDAIANVKVTGYLDSSVVGPPYISYYYAVRAVDYGENMSYASNQVGEFEKSLDDDTIDPFEDWPWE